MLLGSSVGFGALSEDGLLGAVGDIGCNGLSNIGGSSAVAIASAESARVEGNDANGGGGSHEEAGDLHFEGEKGVESLSECVQRSVAGVRVM